MLICGLNIGARAVTPDGFVAGKFYQIVDGRVDTPTYNGFRRYHAGCNHCHAEINAEVRAAYNAFDRKRHFPQRDCLD